MIHHITAISRDAQETKDFYTNVLGLRLVKVTINQDDIETYHLYFGDKKGSPGTVLTFFPWKHLPKGSVGNGMVGEVYFFAPENSFDFWKERLEKFGLNSKQEILFQDKTLSFNDPDGLRLRLIFKREHGDWASKDIPIEFSIKGFAGAKLFVQKQELTAKVIKNYFNYNFSDEKNDIFRYVSKQDYLDIYQNSSQIESIQGLGTVHHIAFRVKNKIEQENLRERLINQGFNPSPLIDRYYFSSVYFLEPCGILFEIATDEPGFDVDEDLDKLGSKLVLPPKFEKYRTEIQEALPELKF